MNDEGPFFYEELMELIGWAIAGWVGAGVFFLLVPNSPEVVVSSIVTALVAGFLLSAVGALFLHAFDGPAALAAKTDPEWVISVTPPGVRSSRVGNPHASTRSAKL